MADRPTDGTTFPDQRNAESVLGDADAVQKTTYVVGSGADPDKRSPVSPDAPQGEGTLAAGPPGGTTSIATWAIVAVLVIGVALLFLLGVNR